MKKAAVFAVCAVLALAVLLVCGYSAGMLSRTAPAFSDNNPVTVVIDAGHGGEDGGASSKSGVLESTINLEIAGITNDLLRFAGVRTAMVRTQDVSVYTEGGSIQQKKVSDLKNRVRFVESTPNALLLSIHQNFFPETKYHGAQVFYAKTLGSEALAEQLQATLRAEYAAADPDVTVTFTPGTVASKALSLMDTKKVCCFLNLYPNGIESMSMDIPGLVQTSCNLGIFKVGETGLAGSGSVRSSVASRKQLLIRRIRLLTESLGGTLCVTGEYPAWEYRRESHLRDVMCEIYKSQYGEDMKVEAIHAGLECGLFCGKIPGLDAVSFGPNLYDIHTTAERMSISSVQRVYAYLCEVLKALKD